MMRMQRTVAILALGSLLGLAACASGGGEGAGASPAAAAPGRAGAGPTPPPAAAAPASPAAAPSGVALGRPAGTPRGVFQGMAPAAVRDRLVARCASRGSQVLEATTGRVLCAARPTSGEAGAAPRGAAGARQVVEFVLRGTGPDTVAEARAWLETPGSDGAVRRQPQEDALHRNYLQRVLWEVGAARNRSPPGQGGAR
jgi:hypothetical protein